MPINHEPYPFERVQSTDPSTVFTFPEAPPIKRRRPKRARHFFSHARLRITQILRKSLSVLRERQTLALLPVAFISARASILGELYPFGFSVLAAFGYAKRERILPLAILCLLGMFTSGVGITLNNTLCLLGLSILLWKIPHLTRRPKLFIASLSGLTIFVIQTLGLLPQGILYYQEMIIVIEALSVFFLTYVLLFCSEALRLNRPLHRFNFEEISSTVLLGGILLLGISDWSILGISLCSVLCRSAILYTAYFWGSGGGTMMGVTAGIIPSLTTGLFAQSLSMYAASGLLAGWFRKLGRIPVIMAFFSGILAISFYAVPAALTLQNLEESALAALLFYFTADFIKNRLPLSAMQIPSSSDEPLPVSINLSGYARQRIDCLAQVFDEIGDSLSAPEEKTAPSSEVGCLNYLYENIQQQLCAHCALNHSCWEQYAQTTSEDMLLLFEQAEKNRPLTQELLPARLKHRCIHRRELAALVNRLYETLQMHTYFTEKIDDSRKLISQQMQGAGDLIRGMVKSLEPMFRNSSFEESPKNPVFRVETGAAQSARANVCGDSFSFLPLSNGKFAAILSDGMGVGESARNQSQTVIRLLQSMLKSGFDLDVILKTINRVLLLRTVEETFATLDLLLIDLSSAEATLIKTAAAPTFIKRRDRLRTIHSSSLPVGILQELDVHRETFRLEDNDLIVLISDGMMDPSSTISEKEWMQDLLKNSEGCNCQYLADTLLSQTTASLSGTPADDMTVLCLRLTHL